MLKKIRVEKHKFFYVIVLVVFGIILLLGIARNVFLIIPNKCESSKNKIGIIDGYLSKNVYQNVVYESSIYAKEKTHGDQLLEFIHNKNYKGVIYYYSAVNAEGVIDNTSVLEGLKWMEKNNISNINISMSTKKRDALLEKWINDHPDFQIYCSYSNKENSFDYPAMYQNVIASGVSKKIEYKSNDRKYNTNKLLIKNGGLHKYKGNSFLSVNTLLEQ